MTRPSRQNRSYFAEFFDLIDTTSKYSRSRKQQNRRKTGKFMSLKGLLAPMLPALN